MYSAQSCSGRDRWTRIRVSGRTHPPPPDNFWHLNLESRPDYRRNIAVTSVGQSIPRSTTISVLENNTSVSGKLTTVCAGLVGEAQVRAQVQLFGKSNRNTQRVSACREHSTELDCAIRCCCLELWPCLRRVRRLTPECGPPETHVHHRKSLLGFRPNMRRMAINIPDREDGLDE